LGRADPIFINELSDAEVDEMRHAAPRLAPLLADAHPARDVTRNLFRLARLASRPGDEPVPRTEAEMAEQWWQTADGKLDGNRRERARLLKALAEQALSHVEPLDVSNCSPQAINELVASETLRDLGNDRVVFRHDVLREWAIANLLYSEPTTIERLSLDHRASAVLARGVELTSRMILERAGDVTRWQSLVDRLSREGTHGSWRRAVLLALVRSEVGAELLTRTSTLLLANRASMVRELIRIVMAVDVEPASKRFERLGLDPTAIPETLNIPSGPSWHRLIVWLLGLGETLPMAAMPDVVDLYTKWPVGTLGFDPLTPSLLEWLYRWLTEIERTREAESFREPFGGEFDRNQIDSLESDLRTGFLLFCNRTPALAAEYLRWLRQRRYGENTVRSILKFRGTLAQAAPAELADLTATALIPKRQPEEQHDRDELREPFSLLDHEFLPPSPAQGPFFDLLTHAPQHGLSLIHRLVDHAISFYTGGRDFGDDAITISFSDGDRIFPWTRSYAWSRDQAGAYSVTSALLALEAWAHRRIDGGDDVDKVVADVLGPPGSPAAYLLVAVDLVLSHWPKSQEVAVPFLGCPELLCIDRERQLHDGFEYPDIFGLSALQKEPVGIVSVENLKKRASRQHSLEELLGEYAVFGPAELRETLKNLLLRTAERLGSPDNQSTLRDPAFMVVHALNLLDPGNWPEMSVTLADGTQQTGHQYVPPDAERRHLAALQDAARDKNADINMQFTLGTALDNPSRSSPEFAAAAVEWAQRAASRSKNEDGDEDWMREQAVVTAAMIVMRDGDGELRARHAEWARGVFTQALQTKEDPVHRFRRGLRYNPVAIAYVGMVHSLRDPAAPEDLRALLEVAGRDNPAAAHGFGAAAIKLASFDERLLPAILRCAFVASIRPSHDWNLPDNEIDARSERHQQLVQAAVDAELAWLTGNGPEPSWPEFPREVVRRREGIRIPRPGEQPVEPTPHRARPKEYVDHQAAALWLSQTLTFADVTKRPWLREIAHKYASWTTVANGAGLKRDEHITHAPHEWNNAYFNLVVHCLSDLALPEIEQLALAPISSLPDEPFFDITTPFLRRVDEVFFNDGGLQESIAISIRAALAKRLMMSSGWKRLGASRSASIERHIGPAIAAIFFNDYGMFQPAKCYFAPTSCRSARLLSSCPGEAGRERPLAFCRYRYTQPLGSLSHVSTSAVHGCSIDGLVETVPRRQ
jgi:hypothetical protein